MKLSFIFIFSLFFFGCATTEKGQLTIQHATSIKQGVLSNLYKEIPGARAIIGASAGYVVFSDHFLKSQSYIKDNYTGEEYFSSASKFGFKKEKLNSYENIIVVFHTQTALNNFIQHGWQHNDVLLNKANYRYIKKVAKVVAPINDFTVFLSLVNNVNEVASAQSFY